MPEAWALRFAGHTCFSQGTDVIRERRSHEEVHCHHRNEDQQWTSSPTGSASIPTRCPLCPVGYRDWLLRDRYGPMWFSSGGFLLSCSAWHPTGHPTDRGDRPSPMPLSPIPLHWASCNLAQSPLNNGPGGGVTDLPG